MIFYITYRTGQEHLLPGCVNAVRTCVQEASRVVVVGPLLPEKVAGPLKELGVEYVDHSTVFPGLTANMMVVVPRGGGDMGPELFQRLLSWTLAYRVTQPSSTCYAVAHATFAPTAAVSLTAGERPLLPLDARAPDGRVVATVGGLIGPFKPAACFARDYMVFDKRIVEKLVGTMAQLNPRRRMDEIVLNHLNLDDPEFSEFDTYGWFAVTRYPQHSALRRPDGSVVTLKAAATPSTANPPGGGVFVSFGKPKPQ